jgi:hypothetical protein
MRLQEHQNPITCFVAKHNIAAARGLASDQFQGLANRLLMACEAQVILVQNVWQEAGLSHGVSGIVKDIVSLPRENKTPVSFGSHADFLLVGFPSYTGPAFLEEFPLLVPIAPRTVHSDDFRYTRTQFPLRLAYATTIHKAQGETYNQGCVVNLGKKESAAGE